MRRVLLAFMIVLLTAFTVGAQAQWENYEAGKMNCYTVDHSRSGHSLIQIGCALKCPTGSSTFTVATMPSANGYLLKANVYSGATAPTNLYDISLFVENEDITGSELDNIASASLVYVVFYSDARERGIPFVGPLKVTVTNNAVNNAEFTLILTVHGKSYK